jgi:signal transduction histidine kinase
VRVTDDGAGRAQLQAEARGQQCCTAKTGGFGLSSLRAHCQRLGGQLTVVPRRGGTLVQAIVPPASDALLRNASS